MEKAKSKEKQVVNSGNKVKKSLFLFFLGGLIGIINGFFGGGGGVVGVPVLEKFLKLENKKAHATCLAVILPLSIISVGVYVYSGVINSNLFLFIGSGVILGGIVGALLLKILPAKVVRVIFALLLLAGGVRLILCWF